MSVPVWSTPSGSLGTVSELNFFALGLEAYDSVDPSRPLSFELVAGTPPSGVHIDSYGTIAGSPDTILRETDTNDSIARIRFKQITSKFAVRARVADYYETFTSNGNATRTQFILTQPITFDITRVLAVINDNAIITTRFKKSSTGVVTVTLNRALAAAGETLVISLYQAGAAVADRTFSMTIVGSNPPKILKFDPLGTYFDGQYVDIDITALDLDIEDTITWSLSAGQLPDGVTLDKHTGKISGFIRPYYVTDAVRTEINNLGFDDEQFDGRTYDNDAPTVTTYPILSPSTDIYSNYQFTITVSDGNKENAKSYNLRVISSSDIKVSSDQISVDDNTFTVDSKVTYSPLMKTEIGEIGPVLHDNNFMYKFDAIDYNGDTIEYFEDNSSETGFDNSFDGAAYDIGSIGLPTSARDGFDLTLDADTGWIQGTIPVLPDLETTYKFNIRARKKDVLATNPATGEQTYYKSRRKQFQLTISGQESVGVVWDTPANLGSMDNGAVSELEISATAQTSNTIYYELLDGSHSRLPQGLKLLDNGLLIGRTTFSTFECDAGTTTFDKKNFYISETTIDRTYSFTVRAYDVNIKTPTIISHTITNITSAGVATVTSDTYTKGQIFNITAMGTTVTGFPIGTYYVIPYIDNSGSPYYTERVTGTSIMLASTYANAMAQPPVPISGVSTSAIASSTVLVTPNITFINTDGVATVTYNTYLRGQAFHVTSRTLGTAVGFAVGTYYVIDDVTGTRITLASSYINAMNNTPISTVTASGTITASSVIIKSIYHTVNTTKTFTLALKKAFVKPYENLYIAARLPKADRLSLSSYLEDTAIIPTANLYRPEDSNFGLAKDLRLLMANGVNPASAADYVGVISKAHYNKQLYFGKAKTARVLNNDNSVRYEIVYLDVLDDLQNSEGINVTPAIDVTDNKIPFSADMDSIDVATTVTTDGVNSLYPNNLANMRRFITRTLGQVNKALPDWMTDMQEDGRVLGFTTGCVLAYVVPGTAKKIAYRLNNSDLNFNNLHVVADRYVWDNNLTRNYNKTDEKFLANELTTFDLYTEKYVPSTVSNMGAGAEFIVVSRDNLKYKEVNIVDGGNEYRVGDQITIPGSNLSGVDFVNDALITVTEVYNKKLIRDWKPHTTYMYGEPDIKYNNKVYRIRHNFTSGDTFTEMTGVTTISGTAETLGKLRDVTPLSGTAINVGRPDAITLVGGTAIPAPLQTGAPVPTIAVTGTGAGLTINISKLGTGVAYTESNTSVSIAALGGGYRPADLVKVSGAVLGGTSPANDLIIRVTDIQVTIYTSIPTLTLTGSGVGATVTVVKLGSDTTYTPDNISISVETLGIGYTAGDTLKVLGTYLGGTTPTNDLVFTVLPTESLTYSSVNTVTMTGIGTGAKVTVTKSGPPILTAVQATSIAGTFSCSDAILEVNQTVTISGTMSSSPTIPLVQITGTAGTFSCTNTTLAVGQSIKISGNASNVATAPLTSVQITSTRGTFSCTPLASLTSLYVGQEITISDALAGTGSIAEYINPPATYYIIATDGHSTFTLSTSPDPTSTPLTTVAGTTTGATFTIKYGLPPIAGYVSPTTYYITATNGINTFTLSEQINGLPIITNSGTPTGWTYTHNIISDYSNPTTYYITNTDGKNVFTLSKSRGGSPIVTMKGTPSGLIFSGTGTSYTRANTVIDITVPGKDYFTGDIIKVLGTELGGTSPANDLTFTAVARYMQPYDDGSTIALRLSTNSGITVLDQQIVDGRILSATVSGLSVANGVYGSTGSPKSGRTEVQGRSFIYADGADFVEPLLAPDGITLEYPYNPRVADPESRQKGTITTFDGNSMQFFANKDAYATQDQGDAYLKWPKMNIFHMQRLS